MTEGNLHNQRPQSSEFQSQEETSRKSLASLPYGWLSRGTGWFLCEIGCCIRWTTNPAGLFLCSYIHKEWHTWACNALKAYGAVPHPKLPLLCWPTCQPAEEQREGWGRDTMHPSLCPSTSLSLSWLVVGQERHLWSGQRGDMTPSLWKCYTIDLEVHNPELLGGKGENTVYRK